MPVYEYRCTECARRTEEIQPMGAGPPGACAECGGELRSVYCRVVVRFSGWGFSRTDSLLPGDRPKKDFRQLRDKAEEISEG